MSVPPNRPTKPKTTINRTFAQRPTVNAKPTQAQNQANAMLAQNQARSTGRKQPLTESQAKALGASARNRGIQARQVTPAELSRIKAGNKHRNTKRPPKQAVQIKPSASKIKGPTNAPLKSRRASAQNSMAQRKASMMARRSK